MNQGLTAVPGVKVGHETLGARPTGCTVVLVERGAVAGVDVRGSAPGTRETDLLNPVNTVEQVHAIVLTGGSAFGLDAAIRRDAVPRGARDRASMPGSRACRSCRPRCSSTSASAAIRRSGRPRTAGIARPLPPRRPVPSEGNVGAGAGATVGKLAGRDRAMKGGIGSAAIRAAGRPDRRGAGRGERGGRRHRSVRPARSWPACDSADGRGLADVRQLLRAGSARRHGPARTRRSAWSRRTRG